MKTLVNGYSFNAAARQITFTEIVPPGIESVLLVTNVTRGVILYNFADSSAGGTLTGNVLGLAASTTDMSNTDALQIFIDLPNPDHEGLTEILRVGLVEIVRQLQAIRNDGGMADAYGRVRVSLESAPATVPTNVSSMGSYNATTLNMSATNIAAKSLRTGIITT